MRVVVGGTPRVRGDDPGLHAYYERLGGTPPRARGRRSRRGRAGDLSVEHPRVRGDDSASMASSSVGSGTPPRARGRHRITAGSWGWRGNTPACAGTTPRCGTGRCTPGEHPRVRGDDSTAPVSPTGSPGTPPRARGRPGPSGAGTGPGGNTPACAGTTGSGGCASPGRTEHPRVRGDDTRVTIAAPAPVGTPPRARGRLETVQHPQQRARNTPACAGTTPPRASPTASGAEHPRVRGDDGRISGRSHPAPGTPPRARGRQHFSGQVQQVERNTPACAGTTMCCTTRCGT